MANLLLLVMGAFAEFERALISERQREGISLAKLRGVYHGCKKALSNGQTVGLLCRAGAGEPKATLAREFGISRETLYQYLKGAPGAYPGFLFHCTSNFWKRYRTTNRQVCIVAFRDNCYYRRRDFAAGADLGGCPIIRQPQRAARALVLTKL